MLDHLIPDLQPDYRLANIAIEFANLRSGVQAGRFKSPLETVSHLLRIDEKLHNWKASLPPSWKYVEYPVKTPTDAVLENRILEYRDIWTCSIYGKWRCIRIFLHEILVDLISQCSESQVRVNPTSDIQSQLEASRKMLRILVSEVAASIPYMMGYRKGEKLPPERNIPAMGGMLCCWPLFVIGGMLSASDSVRAWSIRRLLSIGADMGIYQALTLASVLRKRQEIAYWKERLAKEPIEKLPAGDISELCDGDALFEEGSPEWMSMSDLNTMNEQLSGLRVTEPGQL